ncbi:MAG: ABC transporter ATP-binding protein [Candidatus Caldarchaeum sp.]|uniref:ABC transporter ATP-binding protein n=1 Tax=Caldiarchaeum subterraneum TaxID=311458 RepID=A0A7C5U4F2_CALS0
MIKTHKLSIGYSHGSIVSRIEVELRSGEFTVVVGPNASGKTTFLKTLAGLLKPVAGTVFLGEDDVKSLSARSRARRVGLVLTGRPEVTGMLVEEVVALGRYPWTGPVHILTTQDKQAVQQAMAKTGITHLHGRKISELSDGQFQRVMIARALAQQPKILILDEPTTHLDTPSRVEIMMLLRRLAHDENMTVVASTHELELAFRFADKLLLISDNQVKSFEDPEELINDETFYKAFGFNRKLSFSPLTLTAEFRDSSAHGKPIVFVIAGGGSGAKTYRKLLKKGIKVVTGVLHENDIDHHIATMLGLEAISEKPFQDISEGTLVKAVEKMLSCDAVIYTSPPIGENNKRNLELLQRAIQSNKPVYTAHEIERHGLNIIKHELSIQLTA